MHEFLAREIGPNDPEWPASLRDLGDEMPKRLWVRGADSLSDLTEQSVAVIGARACTEYGRHIAFDLGHNLSDSGWTVVSGGAFGVDISAHRGATMAANRGTRPTVVVLPCGVDMAYPAPHRYLFDVILNDGGLLVSEYAPGETPRSDRFLARNRIIAALTSGMVMVESLSIGGSVNAFGWARKLGRSLMAVPGPVTSAQSDGTFDALASGATPVRNGHDVVKALAN